MPDLKMPDLNTVMLAGRLTRDPELKYLSNGTAVCSCALAVSRKYKAKDSKDTREETVFVDFEAWRQVAEWMGDRLHKGDPVLVSGSLKSDQWEDRQTGQKRSRIMVRADRVQALAWDASGNSANTAEHLARKPKQDELPADDDVPF